MSKTETAEQFNYIDSVNLTLAKRFAKFVFQDTYVDVEKNFEMRTFDIYVTDDVDQDMVNYWKEYFGKSYRFFKKTEQKTEVKTR